MSHKRLLVQCQLSNYNTQGKFILECDSGWQMVIGRVREMLRLNPELDVTVMGPDMDHDNHRVQCITHPEDINPDLWERYGAEGENRLHYFEHRIIPNAIVTRYDFDWTSLACGLNLGMQKIGQALKWDAVYINDPMHLRNFKAMFHVVGGYQPKFFVHSHFIDNPSCPKFPKETSMWLGQCEAACRADFNFWQCGSSMDVFFKEMADFYTPTLVEYVRQKSVPWDDGYSATEISTRPNMDNVRFDANTIQRWHAEHKKVIFVPNRIGGRGRSSDYTNCGKFMFELLPQLRQRRQDFVVVAGNPSQKFSNLELTELCGRDGYVSLVPDAFNRDEFKVILPQTNIALGLYDQDSYGGTAARECVELGCMPLWLDNYEYSSLAREAGGYPYVCRPDFSDLVGSLSTLMDRVDDDPVGLSTWRKALQKVVYDRCSYEATTPAAMEKMGLL